MNSAEYVNKLITDQKAAGTDPQQIAWNAALACVGSDHCIFSHVISA